MTKISLEEFECSLTEAQRAVIECFSFEWQHFTVKDFYKKTGGKYSMNTIRRAVAKLCELGAFERLEAEKKGRGYTNIYRYARESKEY